MSLLEEGWVMHGMDGIYTLADLLPYGPPSRPEPVKPGIQQCWVTLWYDSGQTGEGAGSGGFKLIVKEPALTREGQEVLIVTQHIFPTERDC